MLLRNRRSFIGASAMALALLTGACGSESKGNKQPDGQASGDLNGSAYIVVTEDHLERSAEAIRGSGSVVFNAPLSSVASNNSYHLQMSLEDGGSVTLVAHSDRNLNGGYEIGFKRQGTQLKVTLRASNQEKEVSSLFTSWDASKGMNIQVDLHNEETPSHVLIWDASAGDFSEDAAVLNSEDDTAASPGKGTGALWGLKLTNATVTQVKVGEAKFVEE